MENKMIKFVLRSVVIMLLLTVAIIAAYAAEEVHCPIHEMSVCYYTGRDKWDSQGHQWQQYHCSCNDNVWVKVN